MKSKSLDCSELPLKVALEWNADPELTQVVIDHLDDCSACRQRVEALAATQEQWQEANQMLMAAADQHETSKVAGIEALAIQLLEPAKHPELLGRLGRYDIERLIGSGGMGVVFKGFDTELNRPVAIKVLSPHLAASGPARQRFAREARAAAAVVHEHVVPIYNVESSGQTPLLVMQFISGESLQARIDREGPLELEEILRIGMQVALGLAAAHAQGLIHRDVKPGNILLDHNVSRAALTDFGLAHAQDDACLTRSGLHPGTPEYMSPEQVRGTVIDARSDLFSLGSVLYCLCTGHPPFRAPGAYAVMRRITDERPRSIVQQNAKIPGWFEVIVMKLLEKSAGQRFGSASEVAELFAACLAHVQQPTSSPLPRLVANWSVTNRTIVAAIGLLVGLCVVNVMAMFLIQDPPSKSKANVSSEASLAQANAPQASEPAAPQTNEPTQAPKVPQTLDKPTLKQLVAKLGEHEQSYWPFKVTTEENIRFRATSIDANNQLNQADSGEPRSSTKQVQYVQASLDTWLSKEIEGFDKRTHYQDADGWVQLLEAVNGSSPPQRRSGHVNVFSQRIMYVPALEGIFQPGLGSWQKFLSQAIVDGDVLAKLNWDKEDAVLDAQLVDEDQVRLRLWLSRAHDWHPTRLQRYWIHDTTKPFAEWQATKLDEIEGRWRIVEGTVRCWKTNQERKVTEELTSQTDFKVFNAKYGPDANITVTRPDDGSPKVGDEIELSCQGDIGKQFLKKYTLNADAIVDFANLNMSSTKAFVERVEPTHIVLISPGDKGGLHSSGRTLPVRPALRLRVARSRIQEVWTPKRMNKPEYRWKSVELNEFDLDMIEVVEQQK